MAHLVRCTLAELAARESCVVCGRADAAPSPVPLAAGVSLAALAEHVPPAAQCQACRARADRLDSRLRRVAWALAATPAALASAAVVLLPLPFPAATWGAFALAYAFALLLVARARRRAQREAPVLVLGGRGDEVDLQITPPAAPPEPEGPYRSPGRPSPAGEVRPRRPDDGLAWAVGLSVLPAMLLALWVFDRTYPEVRLDNPADETFRVALDDLPEIELRPGRKQVIRMRYGTRRITVTGPDGRAEGVSVALPWAPPPLRGARPLLLPHDRRADRGPAAACAATHYDTHGPTRPMVPHRGPRESAAEGMFSVISSV